MLCMPAGMETVKLLLDRGSDVYGSDLKAAAEKGNLVTVKLLLQKVRFGIVSLNNALHAAVFAGHADVVKFLIDSGADVNSAYKGSQTVLMVAVQKEHIAVGRILLENDANVNARETTGTTAGWTALSWAAYGDNPDFVRLLLNNGADPDTALAGLETYAAKWTNSTADIAANEGMKTRLGIRLIEKLPGNREMAQPQPATVGPIKEVRLVPVIKSDVDELPVVKVTPRKNAYAVVIGIETYRQKLPAAEFATHDAQIMAEYLVKVLGYPEENVVTLLNDHASNVDLAKYFEKWLPNNAESGSTVFIYYSGHGAPNPQTGDAYLVPYDGDPSFLDQTGYSLKRMYAALGKLPAKEVLVAIDSCFSGAGGRSVLAQGARPLVMNLEKTSALPQNMTVLSAASGGEISSTYREKGHGLFTYFMLKGIKNEDVIHSDGSLSLDDLAGYVKPQVERMARKQYNNEQTPRLIRPKKN